MSLFRRAAWRSHPMLEWKLKHIFIGLPTGVAMFVTVKGAEYAGILTAFDDKHADPKKYAFTSAVYGAPPPDTVEHHPGGSGKGHH